MKKQVVIDTSLAIKWFFPEKGAKAANKLRDDHINKKIIICSRDLFLYEFSSAFRNYAGEKIEAGDFQLAVETLTALEIKIYPIEYRELKELFIMSKKLDLSIYDCSFILLAKKISTALFTADKKLYSRAHHYTPINLI